MITIKNPEAPASEAQKNFITNLRADSTYELEQKFIDSMIADCKDRARITREEAQQIIALHEWAHTASLDELTKGEASKMIEILKHYFAAVRHLGINPARKDFMVRDGDFYRFSQEKLDRRNAKRAERGEEPITL